MSLRYLIAAFAARVGNPSRKLVLLKLADNANDDGICWPSAARIAHDTELSRDTVKRHIKGLECDSTISVRRRVKDGVNLPSVYELIGLHAAAQGWGHPAPTGGDKHPRVGAESPQGGGTMHPEPFTKPTKEAAARTPACTADAAAHQEKRQKRRIVRSSGIVTWTPDDHPEAERIEQQHGADAIGAAIAALAAAGKEPVPGLITREIDRQRREREAAERRAAAEAVHAARLSASPFLADPAALQHGDQLLATIRRTRACKPEA